MQGAQERNWTLRLAAKSRIIHQSYRLGSVPALSSGWEWISTVAVSNHWTKNNSLSNFPLQSRVLNWMLLDDERNSTAALICNLNNQRTILLVEVGHVPRGRGVCQSCFSLRWIESAYITKYDLWRSIICNLEMRAARIESTEKENNYIASILFSFPSFLFSESYCPLPPKTGRDRKSETYARGIKDSKQSSVRYACDAHQPVGSKGDTRRVGSLRAKHETSWTA